MRIDYSDGSFMLCWYNVRAWYTAEGELKDCEKKYWCKGYLASRAISERHTKVRAWLVKQGENEADLLKRGILKRKV
jgi:hypothetical protein